MSGKKKDCTAGLKAEIAVLNRQIGVLIDNMGTECYDCMATRKCGRAEYKGMSCEDTICAFSRQQAEKEIATPKPAPIATPKPDLNSLSAKDFNNLSACPIATPKPDPNSLSAKDFNNLSAWEKWQNWKGQKGIWKCKSCKAVMEDGPRSPGAFEGSAIVCGECDFELTRRTPGGQSNPFEWVLV